MADAPANVALVTCGHHGFIDYESEGQVLQALASKHVAATWVRWDHRDEGIWGGFDAIVMRTPWDYYERADEFLERLGAWERLVSDPGSRLRGLINSGRTIRANLEKTYMRSLEERGVTIVPTLWARRGEEADVLETARSRGWGGVVCKPVVGGAASGLSRFESVDDAGLGAALSAINSGGPALVQPFLPSVVSRGEISVVMLDGEYSHAVLKRPAEGDFRVQCDFGGVYSVTEPDDGEIDLARRSLVAWEDAYGEVPAYARVDIVRLDDGEPAIGELELFEPELFFSYAPGSAERFASVVCGRVGAL